MYGAQLKKARKKAGYNSAREFAERIGINSRTYSSYEQNEREMPIKVACYIADKLNISLDYLCGRFDYIEDGGRHEN